MFFAQTLAKKLNSTLKGQLNQTQDCLFPYKFVKKNNTTFLAELKSQKPSFTHIQLKQMTKNDYLRNFSTKNLQKKWDRKCKVSYAFTTIKLRHKMNKKTLEAKEYVKNLVDNDIFQMKQQRWDVSTKLSDTKLNMKEKLRKVKYEANHCINNKLTKNKINKIYNDNSLAIHNDMNNGWNVSSKLEEKEKGLLDKELFIKSMNNTQKYWFKKNYPLRDNKNKNQTINGNSFLTKTNIKQIINTNSNNKNKLFEENKNNATTREAYLSKRSNLINNNSSKEISIKKKNLSDIIRYKKLKNYWKDEELIEKIKLIDEWSEPSVYEELNKTYRPNELKQEMLKKLMVNKEKINFQQKLIKQEKKYENLIKNIKESQSKKSPLNISKYPMSFDPKTLNKNKTINEIHLNDENQTFIEACQKLIFEQNNQNKNKKRSLSSKSIKSNTGKFIYIHPGIYREFKYNRNIYESVEGKENKKIEEEQYMAWSCCNNIDKNSQGCEKIFVKFDSSNIEHNIL